MNGKFALLTFNRNENEKVIKNLNLLKDFVHEIVIIDSSSKESFEGLMSSAESLNCKIFHVLPLGYPEPLRSYALSKVSSDFVLYLDADETPSVALLRNLKSLTEYDAYIIRRKEREGFITFQTRVYRKKAVTYKGTVHELPLVRGTTLLLDSSYYITHGEYTFHNLRRGVEIEASVRPFPYRFFPRRLRSPIMFSLSRESLKDALKEVFTSLWLLGVYLKYPGARDSRLLSLSHEYYSLCYEYFASMPLQDRVIALKIYSDFEKEGVIKYLSLDDPTYVEKLSAKVGYREDAFDLFKELLHFKFSNRKCMSAD